MCRNTPAKMKESAQAPDIQVLNQEIEVGMHGDNFESPDRFGRYRLRIGKHVRYLTIATDVFDEETMSIPYLLLPRLPTIPDGPWTTMNISKGNDGSPRSSLSYEPLEAVTSIWHPQQIDILSLPEVRHLKSEVYETIYQGRRAIAKMASFDWQIGTIEDETFLYSLMTQDSMAYKYIPGFIGHLTENGRVMGMLLEFLEGRAAGIEDLERCTSVLSWLHGLGIVHGDANRYNFVVNNTGHVYVIDFANTEPWTAEGARKEMEGLREQLEETHLRGAPFHDC